QSKQLLFPFGTSFLPGAKALAEYKKATPKRRSITYHKLRRIKRFSSLSRLSPQDTLPSDVRTHTIKFYHVKDLFSEILPTHL
ncbi:MAG: hypothetical protein PHY23_06210, partial [Oscillospiraceae bacterium]|nr:hypothetical protein [Oscillospiraceae bacterium]